MLKDALAHVAGQKQRVRAGGRQRRKEAQFGGGEVLRLIEDDVVEGLVRLACEPIGECC